MVGGQRDHCRYKVCFASYAGSSLLQRRAPYMAHKGRCNIFNLLHNSLNRFRFKELCSKQSVVDSFP